MDRVTQLQNIQSVALQLFTKKNNDYGNSFETHGLIGILVRIQDKINRCLSITEKCVQLINDESLLDTLLDLHNYSAIGLMFLDYNKETNKEMHKEDDTLLYGKKEDKKEK